MGTTNLTEPRSVRHRHSLTTNSSGGGEVRQLYHPYGTVRWSSGALGTDYTFTGQRHDGYTQLIQMGARWYNGRIGRWVSADTIVPGPSNPQNLNRYAYVDNRPLNHVDPTGRYGEEIHYDLTLALVFWAVFGEAKARGYPVEVAAVFAYGVANEAATADLAVDDLIGPDSSVYVGDSPHWWSHSEARQATADAVTSADPQAFGRARCMGSRTTTPISGRDML